MLKSVRSLRRPEKAYSPSSNTIIHPNAIPKRFTFLIIPHYSLPNGLENFHTYALVPIIFSILLENHKYDFPPGSVVAARCHEKILPNCWMSLNYPTPLVGASRDILLTSSNPLKNYVWENPFGGSSQIYTCQQW